jgi:hypothetical protein
VKDLQPSEAGIIRKRVQQIASNLLAVAGGIVSVVTLVAWLTSAGFRHWVKDNSYWVFGGFATAVVTILVLLNFMQGTNARYAELRRLLRSDALQRADRDRRAMGLFLSRIPPEGAFILWLKKGFNPSSIPLERLDALDEIGQYLSSDPARFEDPLAAAGYRALTTAAGAFSQKLLRWTSLEAGNAQRIIPIEWRPGAKYDHAVAEIQVAKNGLIESYDAFLSTCRERGIEPG